MGNITRDIELKYTPKGTAICDIGLAINRYWSTDGGEKKEEVTFVDVTLWGRQAEIVAEFCKKGQPIYISGRLQLDQWDDKETGKKRSRLKVIGENIQLLGSKPGGNAEGPDDAPRKQKNIPKQEADPDLEPADDSDAIPF